SRRRMRTLLMSTALAACTTTSTFDANAIVSGIYTLDATSQADSCDPPRFVGSLVVPIVSDSSVIETVDQSSPGMLQMTSIYSLTAASGYTLHVPGSGQPSAPCPSGGAFSVGLTLTAASASSFEVTDDESWTIVVPSCTGNGINAATVP